MKKAKIFRDRNYNPSAWCECLEAGCYPYALNLMVNKFFLIGDLIGNTCTSYTSDDELISVFKEELEKIFNFEVEEIDTEYELKKGEKKIYLSREQHTGYYHLLRQDEDGMWSHKFPKELPIREDSLGQIIEDPDAMVEAPFYGWCFLLRERTS